MLSYDTLREFFIILFAFVSNATFLTVLHVLSVHNPLDTNYSGHLSDLSEILIKSFKFTVTERVVVRVGPFDILGGFLENE